MSSSYTEKLYPKRERTKTTKFEEFYTGFSKKQQNPCNIKEVNEKDANIDGSQGTSNQLGNDHLAKESTFNVSSGLINDITLELKIIKDISDKPTPAYLFESITDSSESDYESVVVEGDCLQVIPMPKRLKESVESRRYKNSSAEMDDIPLSKMFGNNIIGPFQNGKDGKLKRRVGRPRKHPIVHDKVKRPVGRPRKEPSQTENKVGKRKRGRPAIMVPYYNAYPLSSRYAVDDDDETDPVSQHIIIKVFKKYLHTFMNTFFKNRFKTKLKL